MRSKEKIRFNCLNCEKEYKVNPCIFTEKRIKTRCCSEKCYKELKGRIKKEAEILHEKVCSSCGVKFVSFKISSKSGFLYCSQRCSIEHLRGENHPDWKGGKSKNNGYKTIKIRGKYELVHRLEMEGFIGRKLERFEVVHHRDGNRLNNSIDNLELMTKREHDNLHSLKRKRMYL